MSIRVLLLGNGGREHALAWKIAQSKLLDKLYVCPGNGGTANEPKTINVDIPATDFNRLVEFAVQNQVSLVVPGPEQPLVDGVETHFRKGKTNLTENVVGIPVFGPSELAARMEGSKAFSKDFMARHNIPTAAFKIFKSHELAQAVEYVKTCGHKVVLKASGLAAGKGVLIPETVEEAIVGLTEIMESKVFGAAGEEVVVEELLVGPEVSVLAFSDGYTIVPLPAAQDHKRIGEGDVGLNTGGMGAYAPAGVATPEIMSRIVKDSLRPTIDGMRKEGKYSWRSSELTLISTLSGFPFVGMLFTGFMLTENGPKVLEYNVRFGDPETEALMLLLNEDVDLVAVLMACAERHLDSVEITCKSGFAVSVVLASQGYPGSYPKGKQIEFGPVPQDVVVFHAGTAKVGDLTVTSGGRVLAVTAYGPTVEDALKVAYQGVGSISFEGKTFRKDIGHRALKAIEQIPGLTYAQAGVSVDAGNELVERIKPFVKATKRTGADAEIGGFGGVFDLKAAGFKDPVLVSGTDGVGTKLKVALDVGIHDTVGIDLVAMSVNDLLVQGAEPLYFLDYYGCSRLDVDVASQVVKGIAEGCKRSGCALIGGETAEMPGMYQDGDYDLAGFAVGAVERDAILPKVDIQAGDILIGLASTGIHSNGFSLVRKILARTGLVYSDPCPWDSSRTLGQALLEPTAIYIPSVLPAAKNGLIKGMSHITGGGFTENIPRVLPKGLGCYVDASTWPYPPVFRFLKEKGGVEGLEMARTFNNGIGLVVIAGPDKVSALQESLSKGDFSCYRIGEVTDKPGVEMRKLESWS